MTQLHQEGEHEHVVAAIEAAILNGQSQPWMYEVLALSMEIAGRPQEEVERILLSQLDFTAADVPSMIFSAAYLTRLKGDRQALRLYRQASRLDPTRPEPYVLGLKLARQLKDVDGIEWGAAGVLKDVWAKGYQQFHRQAEDAALEAEQILVKAGQTARAEQFRQTLAQARQRDLILELTWSGDGDLDLVVEEPFGTVCSVENSRTSGGGIFVHDGFGPTQSNCQESYVCPLGAPGDYRAKVRHVSGNIVGKRATLKIIRYQGTVDALVRTVSVPIERPAKVVRLSLHEGRRRELSYVPQPQVAVAGPSRGRSPKSVARQIGAPTGEALGALGSFSESRQVPFVTGVRANPNGVGFTPIITVLSEGVSSTALAIVSADRRYVRISLSPSFTGIGPVSTFTFTGTPQTSGQSTGGQNNGTSTGGQPAGTP